MRPGVLAREHGAHQHLVLGVGVGVDEAHPDRLDAPGAKPAGDLTGGDLVERPQHLAAKGHPLGNLAHQVERHDAVGLHPEIGVAVAARHRLPRDLQHMAEALGCDEAQPREALLEERVGGHRRAVRHGGDGGAAHQAQDLADAVEHADGGIARSRGRLGRENLAGGLVDRDDVGEGAARVDADPQPEMASRWKRLAVSHPGAPRRGRGARRRSRRGAASRDRRRSGRPPDRDARSRY